MLQQWNRYDPKTLSCSRNIILFTLPVLLLVTLSILGALLFQAIEKPGESCLKDACDKEDVSDKWTFLGSMAYAMSLYTTTGFHSRVPQTTTGRVVSFLYFGFAFPLFIFSVHILGQQLSGLLLRSYKLCYNAIQIVWSKRMNGPPKEDQPNIPFCVLDVALTFPLWVFPIVLFFWYIFASGVIVALANCTYEQCLQYDDEKIPGGCLSFTHGLWLTFLAWSTVGTETLLAGRPQIEFVILCFSLATFSLISTVIHLMILRLNATERELYRMVENYSRCALQSEFDKRDPLDLRDPDAVSSLFQQLVRDQPLSVQLCSKFFTTKTTDRLKDHLFTIAAVRCAENQTKESSFEARIYGIGALPFEFRKSRDDVNALVRQIDSSLRPQRQKTISE